MRPKQKTAEIYAARNRATGKIYVGKTLFGLETRRAQHVAAAKGGSNTYFHKALRKHGAGGFEWRVIWSSPRATKEEINLQEQRFILLYVSSNPKHGYNGTAGGEGGAKTKETRAKMSAAHVGKKLSAEQLAKLREASQKHAEQAFRQKVAGWPPTEKMTEAELVVQLKKEIAAFAALDAQGVLPPVAGWGWG